MPLISVWIVRTALIHLGIGITLGSYMLAAKGVPFDLLARRWLPIHIELLLFGWFLQLALGVAIWVTPRFRAEPKYGNIKLMWSAYGLLNTGIGLTLMGWWTIPTSFTIILVGRLLQVTAVILVASVLWSRIKGFGE